MGEGVRWGHQHQFEASKGNGDSWTSAPPRRHCTLKGLMKEKRDKLKNEDLFIVILIIQLTACLLIYFNISGTTLSQCEIEQKSTPHCILVFIAKNKIRINKSHDLG